MPILVAVDRNMKQFHYLFLIFFIQNACSYEGARGIQNSNPKNIKFYIADISKTGIVNASLENISDSNICIDNKIFF